MRGCTGPRKAKRAKVPECWQVLVIAIFISDCYTVGDMDWNVANGSALTLIDTSESALT